MRSTPRHAVRLPVPHDTMAKCRDKVRVNLHLHGAVYIRTLPPLSCRLPLAAQTPTINETSGSIKIKDASRNRDDRLDE